MKRNSKNGRESTLIAVNVDHDKVFNAEVVVPGVDVSGYIISVPAEAWKRFEAIESEREEALKAFTRLWLKT